jgi:hypothetical protein
VFDSEKLNNRRAKHKATPHDPRSTDDRFAATIACADEIGAWRRVTTFVQIG